MTVYPYNGVLVGHYTGCNTDTCCKTEKPQKQRKKPEAKVIYYTAHLCKVSKIDRIIGMECSLLVPGFQVEEEMGRNQLNRRFSFGMMMSCNWLVLVVAKHYRLQCITELQYFFRQGLTMELPFSFMSGGYHGPTRLSPGKCSLWITMKDNRNDELEPALPGAPPLHFTLTLQTMDVFAPSRAAWTHWLAPFPPKPMKNLCPWMVSPVFGKRGVRLL